MKRHMIPIYKNNVVGNLKFPEGMTGEVATNIYSNAPAAVSDIAIVGALGTMAGIVGKAFEVNGHGLNLYLNLVAPSGVGRISMENGLKILRKVAKAQDNQDIMKFCGAGRFSCRKALDRVLRDETDSFVSMFGHGWMDGILRSKDSLKPGKGFREAILDLHDNSRFGISLVGKMHPINFYKAITQKVMDEGIATKFINLEYNGMFNCGWNASSNWIELSDKSISGITDLAEMVLKMNSEGRKITVEINPDANVNFMNLEKDCNKKVETGHCELLNNLYKQACNKAIRLSGVVAVGTRYSHDSRVLCCTNSTDAPTITDSIAKWSIDIVQTEIDNFESRFCS